MFGGHNERSDNDKRNENYQIVVQVIPRENCHRANADVVVKEQLIAAITTDKKQKRLNGILIASRRIWSIAPWFVVINCLVQIGLYCNANEFLYQHLIFTPEQKTELWRYFTYTLLHSDRMHLMLNVCFQCLIGISLELEQGHWKIAVVYISGGIAGSLATLILQPQLSLLGSSAGIYSLLMSHVPHLMKNFQQLPYRYFRIVALIVLCLSDVGFTVFHFLVNNNESPRICLDAHIAGGATGFLLGLLTYSATRIKYCKGHICS